MAKRTQIEKNVMIFGLAGGSDQYRMPKQLLRSWGVTGLVNVTDAGISAGENFEGLVERMVIEDQGKVIWEAKRDRLAKAVRSLNGGLDTGHSSDPTPVSATDTRFYYNFAAPLDLSKAVDPILTVYLYPVTTEFGGASAATIRVSVFTNTLFVPPGGGIVLRPFQVDSGVNLEYTLPGDLDILGINFDTDVGGEIDRIHIDGYTIQDAYLYNINQAISDQEAVDTKLYGDYFLDIVRGKNRLIRWEANTATTIKGFIMGRA